MDDTISRQAAIDALADYIHNIDKVYSTGKLSASGCKDAAESVIEQLPPAQPEQRWIPCSERLPDKYGEYRITWATSSSKEWFIGDSEYEITNEWDDEHNRFKGVWLPDDYIETYPDVKVIAWKPIEEPYREGN